MRAISRRDFLKLSSRVLLALSGLLGLGGLYRYLATMTDPQPQTDFDLGPASDFPIGSRIIHPEIPAMIENTQGGLTAISLTCTHLGCTVESKSEGYACPCHGSRFDTQGRVIRGPAQKPLKLFRTAITSDGKIHVYTN